MQKIVVNAKPGGFALSREAAVALGLEVDEEPAFMQPYRVIGQDALARDDRRLIEVAESLGPAASGPHAELVVVCIPDGVDWGIAQNDGAEWIAEKHHEWHPATHDVAGYQGVLQEPTAVVAPKRDIAALLAAEAEAAERAEATSDPNEPLPPHVTVTRGRARDDLDRPGNPERLR